MKKETIKIVAFSDYHNKQKLLNLPKADVLIFVGDITNCRADDRENQTKQTARFFKILRKIAHRFKKIIIILGNHDTGLVRGFFKLKGMLTQQELESWTVVDRTTLIEYEGTKILASPYSKQTGDGTIWAYQWEKLDKEKQDEFLNLIDDADIIATHGPILGVGDRVYRELNVGQKQWREHIDKNNITGKIWLSGHIHEDYGMHVYNGNVFYNVSIHSGDRDRDGKDNKPTVININNGDYDEEL